VPYDIVIARDDNGGVDNPALTRASYYRKLSSLNPGLLIFDPSQGLNTSGANVRITPCPELDVLDPAENKVLTRAESQVAANSTLATFEQFNCSSSSLTRFATPLPNTTVKLSALSFERKKSSGLSDPDFFVTEYLGFGTAEIGVANPDGSFPETMLTLTPTVKTESLKVTSNALLGGSVGTSALTNLSLSLEPGLALREVISQFRNTTNQDETFLIPNDAAISVSTNVIVIDSANSTTHSAFRAGISPTAGTVNLDLPSTPVKPLAPINGGNINRDGQLFNFTAPADQIYRVDLLGVGGTGGLGMKSLRVITQETNFTLPANLPQLLNMPAPTAGSVDWGVTSIGGYTDLNDLITKTNGKGHVSSQESFNDGKSGTDFVQNITTGSISFYTAKFTYNIAN
jgi:hypothetical protein